MKRITIVFGLAVILSACNNNTKETVDNASSSEPGITETEDTASVAKDEAEEKTFTLSPEAIAQGKQLIGKSDCLACHKEQEKLIGPAYIDVAKKYEPTAENVSYLSDKIIKGGFGVWGQIPMAPHPTVSVEDAKKMAQYILSLAK